MKKTKKAKIKEDKKRAKEAFDRYRIRLILNTMVYHFDGKATINEVITHIYEAMPNYRKIAHGWRFFVHLNKFPVVMEREGLIKFTGKYRTGKNVRREKLWRVMPKGKK